MVGVGSVVAVPAGAEPTTTVPTAAAPARVATPSAAATPVTVDAGGGVVSPANGAPTSCGFADEATIPGFARAGACWLKANGITTTNPYRAAGVVTRGEMAAFLWRLAVPLQEIRLRS